ncbi:hypothetical protein CP10139811_0366 [Chlamydia ibidis]|uniref:Spermatogenesis-associated protein 20-like TRX domain-containing protein n=2 Tax=Chlamydia ibidis TaxID=1405396 RepID=S7KDU7_9CHLA|nr:thioredoxin domain-containing protein [Chlamydia ibidis]EPP34371.1 hypothetical protein CP10139811_0366 [Chlamydia ibidis]EQM63165.1 hypothetical protein H359_0388 [Chlamydia ibidis 10-1398/6]
MSQPIYTNKLISEKSPYLLLYAHNPVNWYPWGEEAFNLAASEDKPIFLSIGCTHSRWCQIMLQESYANPEIAAMLNEFFVNIKVDKEELPQVASLYFDLAQMLSVSGDRHDVPSWPLNVFLTPDLLPFFSISYLSAEGKLGSPSFAQMIEKLHCMWEDHEEREIFVQQAHKVLEITSFIEGCSRKELLAETALKQTTEALFHDVDAHYGGLKSFPKKTQGFLSQFFLRYSYEYQDNRSLFFVDRTLDLMSKGGIYDHLGGGFYCYTIDDKWLIPCFEKRLIDNAVLTLDYLEAWACLGKKAYNSVARQTLAYLLTELYDAEVGAFYTSEHAEHWGAVEGKNYYTWSGEEIRQVLGENAQLFCDYYGISREGFCNGRNILHVPNHLDIEELIDKYNCSVEEFEEMIDRLKAKLKNYRDSRTQPFKDDQSIAFHNGFMIYVLACSGKILGDPSYVNIAKKCGLFIREHMFQNGKLLRRWREGEAKYLGSLEDYASVILGSLALYQTGCGAEWLQFSEDLMKEVLVSFRCENGGFYTADGKDPNLLMKQANFSDGETISGNALICQALLDLHVLTEKKHYLTHAEDILQIAQARWHTHKFSSVGSLLAAQNYFSRNHKKVLISLGNSEDRERILACFKGKFLPYISLVWMQQGEHDCLLSLIPEYHHHLIPNNTGDTVIYLLEAGMGRKYTSIQEFSEYLNKEST